MGTGRGFLLWLMVLVLGTACGSEQDGVGNYLFDSRYVDGESSVAHGGQTTRHILVLDLTGEMARISAGVLDGTISPDQFDEGGEVLAVMNAFFREGAGSLGTRGLPGLLDDGDSLCQASYGDLSDARLVNKVAGEDDVTDHRDWDGDDEGSTGPAFAGWTDSTVFLGSGAIAAGVGDTPVNLMDALFTTFEAQVRACALDNNDCPRDGDGNGLPLYVTPQGLDLRQLVQKVLIGALQFSQGADDYLDGDVEGKGLRAEHTVPAEDGAAYTALEHAWDEAFGYFGAAVNYGAYTDDEIRGSDGREGFSRGYNDVNGDGCIDVSSEINFGVSVNAAKRDVGSTTGTDFTGEAMAAFLGGRRLIASIDGPLSETQQVALGVYRDTVLDAWEMSIAATVVHYVNDTLGDLAACGTDGFDFADYAKHWSELKGFALGLQFNPRSPVGTQDFDAVHMGIGDRPVLCDGGVDDYRAALENVRNILQGLYGMEADDVANW